MARRGRQMNIFGMSALDLFASALGAFILIALVIFPYFPNTITACPPAQTCPAPVPAPVCPVCPDPVPAPACSVCAAVREPSPTTQFPHLDIVVALDVSGSMGEQVGGLKAEIDQLSAVLIGMTPSLSMGVVAFGDRYWDLPLTVFQLADIGASAPARDALRRFVVNMDVNMGLGRGSNMDEPEAVYDALRAAIAMDWRAQAERRLIVVVTDNPAYPAQVQAALAAAGAFARDGGEVSAVSIGTNGASFLRSLADSGRGRFVRDAGGSLTANVLLSLM